MCFSLLNFDYENFDFMQFMKQINFQSPEAHLVEAENFFTQILQIDFNFRVF